MTKKIEKRPCYYCKKQISVGSLQQHVLTKHMLEVGPEYGTGDYIPKDMSPENIQKSYEEFAEEKDRKLFDSGFTRVVVEEAFHLICPELERRLSLIYAEGLRKHKDINIKEAEITTSRFGGPADNIIRHMKRHLNLWLYGNREEDHLAKVCWAIAELMHQESDGKCLHLNMLLEEKNRVEVKRKHL